MEDTERDTAAEATGNDASSQNNDQKDPLAACQAELADMKNKYLYLHAEFENYKKRTAKEQATWAEYAQDQALLDLLTIRDDMERALHELEGQGLSSEETAHFKGFALIIKNLEQVLKKYDIEEMPAKKVFDPEFFEAVMQQQSDEHQPGEIVAVLQKGYKRKDRVIRPAKVSVAQ